MDGLAVTRCERCPVLVESRTRIVNGVGPGDADILFVGEAPGEQEDAEGEPFVGRSGGVLDEVLREHGIGRADVRITNCVRCRPPENRDPTGEEIGNCRGYLDSEVAAVDPVVTVTLGRVPSRHVLGREVGITAEAGSIERVPLGGRPRDVLLCVHPAATLYDRSKRGILESVVERAAAMAGTGDQSTLGAF